MKSKWLLLAVSSAAALCASAAEAEIVTATVHGVIDSGGTDGSNLFGGGALDGDAATIRYIFDTSLGDVFPFPNADNRSGGSFFGSVSPALSATITVNGASVPLGGGYLGTIAETSDATASYHYYEADESADRYAYSFVTAAPGALPGALAAGLNYTVKPTDNAFGYFQYDNTYAAFAPTSISAAVPEPSTWALMLAGFAALGWAGHRAARKSAATA